MQFVEIQASDGNVHRFASGTKAGFAVERINAKFKGRQRVVCIEAIQGPADGVDPVTVEFGPDVDLADYGQGWTLRAVVSTHAGELQDGGRQIMEMDLSKLFPGGKIPEGRRGEFTLEYIIKVLLCFVFMFFLGGVFKTLLERLPSLNNHLDLVTNDF